MQRTRPLRCNDQPKCHPKHYDRARDHSHPQIPEELALPHSDNKPQQLSAQVRRALLEVWDPIGINLLPEAKDEYDHYVGYLCQLITANASKAAIIEHLWWLETEHMGLCGDREATEAFAGYLVDLRDCGNQG